MIGFQRIVAGTSTFSLLAIPYLYFAGELICCRWYCGRLIRFLAVFGCWLECPWVGLVSVNVFLLSYVCLALSLVPQR